MSVHSGPADWWTEGTDAGRRHIATKGIVQSGLVLNLDAGVANSYPGTGSTWTDLSGNGNHFTLYNSPTHNGTTFIFDGINDYARSINTINLSTTNAITVEVGFKVPSVNVNAMIFEFTSNWNSNAGAFGAFTNSNGGSASPPSTDNDIHTNSSVEVEDFNVPSITSRSLYTFTYASGIGTSLLYNNTSTTTLRNNSVNSFVGFANDHLYIGSRGGVSGFGSIEINYLRLYNRILVTSEINQNFNATRGRYGI